MATPPTGLTFPRFLNAMFHIQGEVMTILWLVP